MMTSNAFTKAEIAAQAQSDQQKLGTAAASCPLTKKEKKYRIEVLVVGDDDKPLGDIAVVLRRASGEELKKVTDDAGHCAFEGLDQAQYEVSLVELDADCWQLLDQTSLGSNEMSQGRASWQSSKEHIKPIQQFHEVKQGECVAKLADHYGLLPATIWDHPENAKIKAERVDMHILNPGDCLYIPAKKIKTLPIESGERMKLKKLNALERLRVRFLHHDESPKAAVPYLLSLSTHEDIPVPDITSQTDDKGFVDQPIPPSTVRAIITLYPGPDSEIYEFNMAYRNPIDTVSGWQSRLNNLGYHCGAEDNELGPRTQAAICNFQRAKGLEETGDRNDETRATLLSVALS
jgi:hypothetical protein